MKLILESLAFASESGTKIGGLALTPRISRNNNFYFPSQLERADGKVVPLRWEHGGASTNIGEAIFSYDKDLLQLNYSAVVTNEEAAKQIRNRKLFVSIGAKVGVQQEVCDQSKNCYLAPQELAFEELSIVEVAGIPESTVNVIESMGVKVTQIEEACPETITSVNENSTSSSMTIKDESNVEESTVTTTTTKREETTDAPAVQPVAAKEVECPEGQKDVDGKCVPQDAAPQEAPLNVQVVKPVENNQTENTPFDANAFKADILASVKSSVGEAIGSMSQQKKAEENFRIAQISPENGSFTASDISALTKQGWNAMEKYGFFKYEVDTGAKTLQKASTRITEALSYGSSQSDLDMVSGVDVIPAGLTDLNVIPFCRYKDIKNGSDTAKFLKGDTPASATITEGGATSATTHTITPLSITADTVKGFAQIVDYSDMEDTPADLFAYITATARARYLEDIATLVLDTAAEAATPLFWMRGDTGAVITSDDIASNAFDYKSLAVAREKLVTQGHSADKLVCFLHPKQYRELVTDSDISTLVQQGDATIAKSGKLERMFGIELIETTAVHEEVAQTSGAYRAIVCVKGYSFAIASKRKMKIEITSDADEFAKKVGFSHRTGAASYDDNSIVRISTFSSTV